MELTKETLEMAKELREILSSVKGSQKISENFILSYIVVVEDEESKENVEKVAEALTKQAEQKGIELEIGAATQEEIEKAQTLMASETLKPLGKSTTFKS